MTPNRRAAKPDPDLDDAMVAVADSYRSAVHVLAQLDLARARLRLLLTEKSPGAGARYPAGHVDAMELLEWSARAALLQEG